MPLSGMVLLQAEPVAGLDRAWVGWSSPAAGSSQATISNSVNEGHGLIEELDRVARQGTRSCKPYAAKRPIFGNFLRRAFANS